MPKNKNFPTRRTPQNQKGGLSLSSYVPSSGQVEQTPEQKVQQFLQEAFFVEGITRPRLLKTLPELFNNAPKNILLSVPNNDLDTPDIPHYFAIQYDETVDKLTVVVHPLKEGVRQQVIHIFLKEGERGIFLGKQKLQTMQQYWGDAMKTLVADWGTQYGTSQKQCIIKNVIAQKKSSGDSVINIIKHWWKNRDK